MTSEKGVEPFGRYQAVQLTLALLPVLFTAMSQGNFVFAAATTEYRCKVPECETPESLQSSTSPAWWPSSVDPHCARPVSRLSSSGNCSSDTFLNRTESCTDYIYEDHNSIVSEFELACQEWKRTLVGTIHNVGVFVSMPLLGYVSDRWGRRPALIISAVGASLGALKPLTTHVLNDVSSRYLLYLALEFLEAAVATATYTTSFVFMLELLGDKKRIASSVALGIGISAGNMLLALASWLWPNWRHLQLAIYCPALLFLSYCLLLDESLRWLLTSGRTELADKLAAKIARWNRRAIADSNEKTEVPNKKDVSGETEQFSIKLLLSSKVLMKRVAICAWWWFSTAFVYYGLLINSVWLPGSRSVNFALVAAAGVPGELGAILALATISRRQSLATGLLLAAVCCLATTLVPKDLQWAQITVYLVGTASITLAFNVVYTYSSELIPTSCRAALLGICSALARLGSVLAPLTPLLRESWSGLPTAVLGAAALSGAALTTLAPHTAHCRLPDTIAQAEDIH